jgi:hypothetical protein
VFSAIKSILKLAVLVLVLLAAGLGYLFMTPVTPGNVQFRTLFACEAGLRVMYPLSQNDAIYNIPAPPVDCNCFAEKFVAEVGATRAVAGLEVVRLAIPDIVRQAFTKRGITANQTDYMIREELLSLQGALLLVGAQCMRRN